MVRTGPTFANPQQSAMFQVLWDGVETHNKLPCFKYYVGWAGLKDHLQTHNKLSCFKYYMWAGLKDHCKHTINSHVSSSIIMWAGLKELCKPTINCHVSSTVQWMLIMHYTIPLSRIAVAMSGGVDSAVAVLMLIR